MASIGKLPTFSGEGNVINFIVKMELHIKLKELTGEAAACLLASRLEGPAFNVYARLSDEDKKDVGKLKEELKKEYEIGRHDREDAVHQDFAFKFKRPVKLAYPIFSSIVQQIYETDFFIHGIHPDLQLKLNTMVNFARLSTYGLIGKTIGFEVTGVAGKKYSLK